MRKILKAICAAAALIAVMAMSSCAGDFSDEVFVAQENGVEGGEAVVERVGTLSKNEKYEIFCRRFAEAIENGDREISVVDLGLTYGEANWVVDLAFYQYPEYHACISSSAIHFRRAADSFEKLSWEYVDANRTGERMEAIRTRIAEIADEIDPDWSDLEKAVWINNWICEHVKYDETLMLRNVYDGLFAGETVCEGLTGIYTLLGRACGLEVSFAVTNEIEHVWNTVRIDGEWYHVDTTVNIRQKTPYQVFLVSDGVMLDTFDLSAVPDSLHTCDSTKYDDAFWRNVPRASLVFVNGVAYFSNNAGIRRCDIEANQTDYFISPRGGKWSDESGYMSGVTYVDLAADESGFYYNTCDSIYYYDITTAAKTRVFRADADDADIFGIYIEGGMLCMKMYTDYAQGEYVVQTLELAH